MLATFALLPVDLRGVTPPAACTSCFGLRFYSRLRGTSSGGATAQPGRAHGSTRISEPAEEPREPCRRLSSVLGPPGRSQTVWHVYRLFDAVSRGRRWCREVSYTAAEVLRGTTHYARSSVRSRPPGPRVTDRMLILHRHRHCHPMAEYARHLQTATCATGPSVSMQYQRPDHPRADLSPVQRMYAPACRSRPPSNAYRWNSS